MLASSTSAIETLATRHAQAVTSARTSSHEQWSEPIYSVLRWGQGGAAPRPFMVQVMFCVAVDGNDMLLTAGAVGDTLEAACEAAAREALSTYTWAADTVLTHAHIQRTHLSSNSVVTVGYARDLARRELLVTQDAK